VSSLTRQAWPHPIVRWPIYTLIEVTPSLAVPSSGLSQPASLLPQIIDALFTILNHRSDTVLPRPDSTYFRGLSTFTHVPWFHDGATAVRFLSVTTSRPYALRQVINFTLEARFLGPCQRLIFEGLIDGLPQANPFFELLLAVAHRQKWMRIELARSLHSGGMFLIFAKRPTFDSLVILHFDTSRCWQMS
jgi:hypothetical protein